MTTTTAEKALALADLGFFVFPANPSSKMPLTPNGHLDAVGLDDPELIATWFTLDYPWAEVGVYTGKSELVVLDIDVSNEASGYNSLGFLSIPDTFNYFSKSKQGRHYIYELSDSNSIPPSNRYRQMLGVDRKSGSSYVVWWGNAPKSRDEFSAPPEWLLDLPSDSSALGYLGDVDDWLNNLPQGEPTATVRKVVENLPQDNFGHQDVLNITYRLVRMAAEGHTGVDWAFDQMHEKWIRPPYDTPETKRELWNAISGAIRRGGAPDDQLSELPEYFSLLEKSSGEVIDIITSKDTSKANFFKAIVAGIKDHFTDDEIAALVFSGPATKDNARDWGLPYLYDHIRKERQKIERAGGVGVQGTKPKDPSEEADVKVSLLEPNERALIAHEKHWVKRYVETAGARVGKQNKPYDRINGLMVLSGFMSDSAYIPRKNGRVPLNLFTTTIGDTTTGKSEARKFMMACMKAAHPVDHGWNIGGNTSESALTKKLLERDGLFSFFNKDEAHGAIKTWMGSDWTAGVLESLAEYYDGFVPPILRTEKGFQEVSGKGARTYLGMHLMGTPDAMLNVLTRDLFLTGFLARMQWVIGEGREVSYASLAEDEEEAHEDEEGLDVTAKQLVAELAIARRLVRQRSGKRTTPVRMDPDAAKRLQNAKWQMSKMFVDDPNWDILEPSLVRMGITIRKVASLLALSDGRPYVHLGDILMSLEMAEEWVSNLVNIASKISASEWERETAAIETFIASKPEGQERKELVARKFKHMEFQKYVQYLNSLIAQGRIREFRGENRAEYYAINTNT